MCYPVCGMVHIKEPLLLIGKSTPSGGSGFYLSLSEWSFIICLTPYNRKYNPLPPPRVCWFQLVTRDLSYAPNNAYNYLCYTSRGELAEMKISTMGPV